MSSMYHGKNKKIKEVVATQRMKKGGRHKEHRTATGEGRSTGTYARDIKQQMGHPQNPSLAEATRPPKLHCH